MWAAGNGGDQSDSCAADGYVSSIYTVGIGSAALDGTQAYYDEECSGKMAVAFVTSQIKSVVSYWYVANMVYCQKWFVSVA